MCEANGGESTFSRRIQIKTEEQSLQLALVSYLSDLEFKMSEEASYVFIKDVDREGEETKIDISHGMHLHVLTVITCTLKKGSNLFGGD